MSGTSYGDEALNLVEAAAHLGCSYHTLTAKYKEWNLIPTKMGGVNYWFRVDLDKYATRRKAEHDPNDLRYGFKVRQAA